MRKYLSILAVLLVLMPVTAYSDVEHKLIRRMAVFPMQVDGFLEESAESSWWAVRELLTKNKKFLVASRNFMKKKDVFQARGELTPADAIILGQLLDAQALVTTYLKKRTLHMSVYEKEYGRLLWSHKLTLHPSLPLKKQIEEASKKLMLDYMSSIPYQGFIYVDSLIGRPVYTRGSKKNVKVEVGLDSKVLVGDKVQFIRLSSDQLKPLFDGGSVIEITAEGVVVGINREIVTVEVNRYTHLKDFKRLGLVRFPSEYKRLRENYSIAGKMKNNINPEYFSPEITSEGQKEAETKPLVAALTFIANIVGVLLLAF